MSEYRKAITSPESFIAKQFAKLYERIDKQAGIILKQQHFLEMVNWNEREMNIMVLGLPDEGEALDGAVMGVRKEWCWLHKAVVREKEWPENAGCNIRLDTQQYKLYHDGKVIDTWNPQFL